MFCGIVIIHCLEDSLLKAKFAFHSKAINHAYEEYVLNVGDFDERIFLGEDASVEIGTPAKSSSSAMGELTDRINMPKIDTFKEHVDQVGTF